MVSRGNDCPRRSGGGREKNLVALLSSPVYGLSRTLGAPAPTVRLEGPAICRGFRVGPGRKRTSPTELHNTQPDISRRPIAIYRFDMLSLEETSLRETVEPERVPYILAELYVPL